MILMMTGAGGDELLSIGVDESWSYVVVVAEVLSRKKQDGL